MLTLQHYRYKKISVENVDTIIKLEINSFLQRYQLQPSPGL